MQQLSQSLTENLSALDARFGNSADYYAKKIVLYGCPGCIVLFDGMASLDSLWELLLEAAGRQSASVRLTGAQAYAHILHGSAFPAESTPVQDMSQLVARLTAGMAVLLLEGCSSGIVFSVQGLKFRSVEEPSAEGNLRGSREGFTDLLRVNLSLLRRLVRTDTLMQEAAQAHTCCNTEYALCYGALLTGLRMKSTRKLERLLDKVVGERDNIPLPELFAAAGVDAARGRAAVKSAIEHGYFGADAYIDNRTDTLVVRGAAPQPKKPAPAPAPKAQPAAEDEYAALLRQLREVNDAIPDPVMSAKISRLEEVSGRIFALAQKDPEKKAQLQKFMNYYLPTALKLLNTYASLSGQAVEGTNITEAKHSIERSMDLLVTAFENQLDKLFQADALDVNADIAALEGMLNLDGLTGSEFTR